MFEGFRKTVLALTAGLTALGGVGAANAQGIYLDFDDRDGPRVGIYGTQEGPTQGGHSYRRHDRERDRWDRDGRDRRGRDCTPARALDKAERLGIRRARIVDVNRRTIAVAGRDHGDRVFVTFARAPNCPVIR